jgi:glycosyltransferase involved in cell wall biosynthesis
MSAPSPKILHVIPSFHPATYYGGPIYSVLGLCNALANHGVSLRVLTTDTAGPGNRRLRIERFPTLFPAGYPVYYCRKWVLNSVSPELLWHMNVQIRWADVVHLTAVYSFPTIPTLLTCKMLGKPVVWSPLGALQRWEGSTLRSRKAVWEQTCRMVLPHKLTLHLTSKEEAEESLKIFPAVKTAIIPHGIEIPEKTSHTVRNGALRLLYIGRIHPKKGIENLLSACDLLQSRSGIEWSLTLAGSGDPLYTESIRARIGEMGDSAKIKMLGEVVGDSKEKLFEEADMVVVPSYTENFGMVVAEALARGVPVIASKGTPWNRVEEIGCGLWVDNDPASLAKAIERMRGMSVREMGRRGRDWMEREYGWDSKAEAMIEVYRTLLEKTK